MSDIPPPGPPGAQPPPPGDFGPPPGPTTGPPAGGYAPPPGGYAAPPPVPPPAANPGFGKAVGSVSSSLSGLSGTALAGPMQLAAWVVAAIGVLYFLYGILTDDLTATFGLLDFLPKFFVMLQQTMIFVLTFAVLMVGGKALERSS